MLLTVSHVRHRARPFVSATGATLVVMTAVADAYLTAVDSVADLMARPEVTRLLQQNLQQEEQTAQLVEQSAQTLLQQAMQAQSVGG